MEPSSAADWFSAIGTVGAFAAALVVIVTDRKRAAETDARAVSAWTTGRTTLETDRSRRFISVSVFNGSSAPLHAVSLYSKIDEDTYIDEVLTVDASGPTTIDPGATYTKEVALQEYVGQERLFIFFISKDGARWARRLSDGRLMRRGRAWRLANDISAWQSLITHIRS